MTSTIIYNGNLRTSCTHIKSGNEIITDAPTDNNGKGEAFSPTDLVATALASCMITIMGIKAADLNITIDGTRATVEKIMASSPRRIERVNIEINFPENDWTDSVKKSLEISALNCPVAKSVSEQMLQNVKFNF